MTSPSGKGRILDLDFVAVVGEPNRMYAVRSGRLFGRPASSTEPYASFGAWKELGAEVSVVAACPVDTRTDSVFVASQEGELRVATVLVDAMGSSEWTTLESAEVQGANALACVRNGEGALQLFADDDAGNIWRSIEPFEDWELAVEAPAKVRAMDAAEIPGGDPMLVIADEIGSVSFWRSQAEGWTQ